MEKDNAILTGKQNYVTPFLMEGYSRTVQALQGINHTTHENYPL